MKVIERNGHTHTVTSYHLCDGREWVNCGGIQGFIGTIFEWYIEPCQCTADETTGYTTENVCNICGKVQENNVSHESEAKVKQRYDKLKGEI
jgi:hypothetical protein